MARLSQLLLLAVVCLLSATPATAAAFTPDAAFKMKSLGIAPNNGNAAKMMNENKIRGPVLQPQQQAAFGNDRNMQLSLIGQENIRKSITVPPAYEDYMAIRQRSIMRLLGRKD